MTNKLFNSEYIVSCKLAFTGDWHLSLYNDKIQPSSRLPDRLDGIKSAAHSMIKKCIELEVKYIVICGDLLHGRSIIYSIAQSVLLDIFREHEKEMLFIVIDGNHDLSSKSKEYVSALKCLDHEPNVLRISSPTKIENIFFVPYSHNMVNIIKENESEILVSHFGLNEGILNSGISLKADIGINDLVNKYKTVILGHYHKPQSIIKNDIRLYYTGSLIELDWGEKEDNKRFLVLDSQTNEIDSYPTVGYRKHFLFKINNENKESILTEARKLKNDGHFIKLEKEDINIDLNIETQEFIVISKPDDSNVTNRGISSSMSLKEKLSKYLDIKKISNKEQEEYLSIVLQLINSSNIISNIGSIKRDIKFKKIGMKNFKKHTNLEMDINEGKLTIISGPNGCGKSTIFDAFSCCLYGSSSKGIRGKDLVNDKKNKDCHLFLEYSINDINYRVDRYIEDSNLGNTVLLKKNGIVVKKGHNEVVDEIERILIPKKLFMNTILFAQKVKTFFTDLKDSDQKEIFRKILQLDEYEEYKQLLSEELNKLSINLIEINNNYNLSDKLILEYNNIRKKLELEKIEFYKIKRENIENINLKLSKLRNELTKKNNSIGNIDCNSNTLQLELEEIISKKSFLDIKIKEFEKDIKTINNDLISKFKIKKLEIENAAESQKSINFNKTNKLQKDKDLELQNLKLNFINDKNKVNLEISIINNKLSSYKTELLKLEKEIKDLEIIEVNSEKEIICPTCNSIIKSIEVIEKLRNKLKELRNKYDESKSFISSETKKKKSLENYIKSLSDKNENNIKLIDEKFKDEFDKLNKEVYTIENELETAIKKLEKFLEEKIKERSESLLLEKNKTRLQIDNFNSKYLDLKNKFEVMLEIKEIRNNIKNTTNELEVENKEEFKDIKIIENEDKIKELHTDVNILRIKREEIKRKIFIFDFWKEAFSKSGIESMLIDECIPFMNERIQKYQENISNGRYMITFDTLKATKSGREEDKTNIKVLDTETNTFGREKLSGGQERIVDISVILTLSDLQENVSGFKTNILLFDEIFDALDENNINNVSRLLKMISKEKAIFIITHTQTESMHYDDMLLFS